MKLFERLRLILLLATACLVSAMTADHASAAVSWLSSLTNRIEVPTRVAVDSKGNIYVTEPRNKNRVQIFDRQGKYLRTLGGLKGPIGVAVDATGRIYVGNSVTGSVDVYKPDFTRAFSLGSGNGEFLLPNSITISSTGRVYVVDTKGNRVKVYTETGSAAFTFGAAGRGDGKFNDPYGIAIDEKANNGSGEVYVTDRGIFDDPIYGTMGGARVQVFDLNGQFIRSFGQFGSGPGQMKMPIGIAADGAGMLYITDPNLAALHVFTAAGQWVESIDRPVLKTPIGVAVGLDRRLFIAASMNPSIEIFALPGYTTMAVSPLTLSFTTLEGGLNPAPQNAVISSGTGTLDWSASTDAAWLQVAPTAGTLAASSSAQLSLAVDARTKPLTAGSYSGTVTVTSPTTGTEEKITVSLNVAAPPAVLSVLPTTLSFKAQQSGPAPLPQSLSVNNLGGGTFTWSALSATEWLKFNVSPGFLTISPQTTGLAAGNYTKTITITAPGAQGSPLTVPVTVQVVSAGTINITSNIPNAGFDITGPAAYSGTGSTWSSDEVIPGTYTLTFKRMPGYTKPVTKKFTLKSGETVTIAGYYRTKPVPTHILAGSVGKTNQMALLPIDNNGTSTPRLFTPFTESAAIRVSAGDLDGAGFDKIIITDYNRTVKVLSDQGEQLAVYDKLPDGFSHADVAVADIDNDGVPEILVSADHEKQSRRLIKALTYAAGLLQEKATLITEDKAGKFCVAAGDVNDDGQPDILVADGNSIRAFRVQQSASGFNLAQLWIKNGDYGDAPQITAGDMNGDGIIEIAVSYDHVKETKGRGRDKDRSSLVSILKGTGEDFGLTIEPFKDKGYTKASTIIMGDLDGDAADEVISGAGPGEKNEPLIRFFDSDGSYTGFMQPLNGDAGVNVGVGAFQQ